MKQLLYTAFICFSFNGFAQEPENKGICTASVQLFHESENDTIPNDFFYLNGFFFANPLYSGSFMDITNTSDSITYEITLPFGDSLLYHGGWMADGMCYGIDTAVVNHILTVLEGEPFQITYGGDYNPLVYDVYQDGVIRNSCFIKIRKEHTYFFRIKFLDPPAPENPLDLPEITNDLSMWLNGENTLFVKTDETTVWNAEFYSLSGQIIQKYRLEGSQTLDISTFPKGCYVAHVSSENGLKKQLKFIR